MKTMKKKTKKSTRPLIGKWPSVFELKEDPPHFESWEEVEEHRKTFNAMDKEREEAERERESIFATKILSSAYGVYKEVGGYLDSREGLILAELKKLLRPYL